MSDLTGLITGLSQGLNAYLGKTLESQQTMGLLNYKDQLETKQNAAKQKSELERQKELEQFKASISTKLTPEAAESIIPGGGEWVKQQIAAGQTPTLEDGIKALAVMGKENDPTKNLSGAEKTVDREFGKEYSKYVASGGYADTIGQIQALEGVLTDLQDEKKNLTGPLIGSGPMLGRKILAGDSVAAQQTVEQSVQRSLKQTLGGQFTEKEGVLFMQRGYDPQLSEAANAQKLKRMIGQLKSMALAKQKAVDYYEEHGTLKGFKGEFFTLSNGIITKASKDDFYKMIGESPKSEESSSPSASSTGGWSYVGPVKGS